VTTVEPEPVELKIIRKALLAYYDEPQENFYDVLARFIYNRLYQTQPD